MPSAPSAAAPRRGRKRAVSGATLLVVAALVVVVVAIVVTSRGDHKKAGTHRAGAFAATVQRRNLVTSESETGTISYAGASTVTNRLQGTLTWTPGVGRVIQPGRKLFDVDNFPVILMNGTTPAYRTLDSSDTPGPDVQQLNENLIDLGFDVGGIVDEDEWQPATTDGVEAFQEANDEPETGSLTLGTVAFLRGAQRVAGLQGAASGVADDDPEANDAEFVGYTPPASAATATTPATTSTTATATTTTTSSTPQAPQAPAIARLNSRIQLLQRQTQVLQREVIQAKADARAGAEIPRLDSRVQELQRDNRQLEQKVVAARSHAPASGSSASAEPGPVSGGDSPVMTTTSTNLVVTVPVPAGQQGVTHIGARVPVVMPSGSTVRGRVTGIGQSSSGKVPITIHLEKHENGRNLDQATVNVKFVAKTARHVLSVPVTALLARPGGRYAVQRDRPPHRLIDVKLGTFATGFVEVSGKGLHPGLKITDSQG